MRSIPLEKITDGIYYLALNNADVECVLTDGRLDMASVFHGVPKKSTLLIEHPSGQALQNRYLAGNTPAINFENIAYILSGDTQSHFNESEHINALDSFYSNVESFDNYGSALDWAMTLRQNHQ
mgnify:CR=1 FL=1